MENQKQSDNATRKVVIGFHLQKKSLSIDEY